MINIQRKLRILQWLLLLYTMLLANPTFSQVADNSVPNIIPSSPTVASIEKYGDYPIGYNTGTVGISTELYNFSLGKGLDMNIRLDYHSSGIKVEEVSGRTGTGWTLSAGGCISRQVRGKIDESSGLGFYNLVKKRKGYTFPDMASPSSSMTADSIAKDILDSSPDIFSLNLLGRNYKFFLGNDGELHTIPYSNLKFSKHPLASEVGGPWEITDESGIRYIFGMIEGVTSGPTGKRSTYDSSWWLTSIVSAEGNVLATLEYKASEPVYPTIQRNTQTFKIYDGPFNFPSDILNIYIGEKKQSDTNKYSAWDLYKISIPGKGSVVFESGTSRPDQEWKLISGIKYYDNNNVLMNQYSLSYVHPSNRPFLSQISKTNPDGTTIKYRSFSYYPNLPSQYSKSQDFWGYYNGANNTSLYPFDGNLFSYSYSVADRYPNDKAVAGTIKEITYPTGGKTLFEFENNKIYGQDSIFSINKERLYHTQTDYGEATSSNFTTINQRVSMKIEMSIHPASLYTVNIDLIRIDNNSTVLQYTNASVPGNDFVYMGVNADGTERFVCTFTDYNLRAGTYKWVTKITNEDDRPNRPKPSPIIISNDYYKVTTTKETHEKLVGGLRISKISNYDNDGKLIGKVNYTYLDKEGKSSGIGTLSPIFTHNYVVTENVCPKCDVPQYSDMELIEIGEIDRNPYSGSAVQYTYVTEEKIGEASQILKTDYEYSDRKFNRTLITGPNGLNNSSCPYSLNEYEEGLLISKTDYEFRNNAYAPIRKENNYYTLKTQGSDVPTFTAISLNKYYLQPEVSPLAKDLLHYSKYKIGTYDFIAAKVYLSSKKVEEITSQATITNTYNYLYENTKYQQLTSSKQINSDGLVSETVYKYCFDDNTSVTNEMKNRNILSPPLRTIGKLNEKQVKQVEVIYGEFPGNILEPKIVREQTSSLAPYSEIVYSNYDSYGNPLLLAKDGSLNIIYLWSYNGQYPIAEIKNATFTEVETAVKAALSVTSIDALSALITPNEVKLKDGSLQKALPNAHVTTYTYKPLVGILSATDPSGITTFYDYDAFGRLKETYIMENNIKKTIQSYDYHYQNQ